MTNESDLTWDVSCAVAEVYSWIDPGFWTIQYEGATVTMCPNRSPSQRWIRTGKPDQGYVRLERVSDEGHWYGQQNGGSCEECMWISDWRKTQHINNCWENSHIVPVYPAQIEACINDLREWVKQ